jgi:hypothetical protein
MTNPPPPVPKLGPMKVWCAHSGLGRAKSYEMLAAKELHGFKHGRQMLIDIEHGLEYLRSLPSAQIRPRTTPRRRSTPPAAPSSAPRPRVVAGSVDFVACRASQARSKAAKPRGAK